MNTQEIVSKLWNLCNVLRDDGITYHQYVTELTYIRIGHARILLKQHPEKRIAEIAELCGYRDAGYFGKVFQKVNGETPDQYRRKR